MQMNRIDNTDILHLPVSALPPWMAGMVESRPAEDGWMSTPVSQFIETKEVPGRSSYSQDDLPGGPHDLGRHIVFLEGIKEEEGNEQRKVEGGIWSKAFEGQHLRGEIFESPMNQLIISPAMSLANDRIGFEEMAVARLAQLFISLPHAQICVENT
jgi:hypothetical protein